MVRAIREAGGWDGYATARAATLVDVVAKCLPPAVPEVLFAVIAAYASPPDEARRVADI